MRLSLSRQGVVREVVRVNLPLLCRLAVRFRSRSRSQCVRGDNSRAMGWLPCQTCPTLICSPRVSRAMNLPASAAHRFWLPTQRMDPTARRRTPPAGSYPVPARFHPPEEDSAVCRPVTLGAARVASGERGFLWEGPASMPSREIIHRSLSSCFWVWPKPR